MKTILKNLSLFLLVCVSASALHAQTVLTNTTLASAVGNTVSSALTTGNLSVVNLASVTGVSAPTPNAGNVATISTSGGATYLYVDRELMQVVSISGTSVTVIRGVGSTAAASHASGALVFVVPAAAVANWGTPLGTTDWGPQGSCTRTNELYLPRIAFTSGNISDCVGGQWITGDASQTTRSTFYRASFPPIGAVAHTGAIGTSTATTAAELYCVEIDMPFSKLITGLAPHVGATGGTDKWIAALYDATGNLVANSTTAGTTVGGTAYAFQALPFTSPYYVVGPAQYFGCVQSNGTTATLDLVTTGTGDLLLTYKSASAGTFGTLPSFTAPTGFTTLQGPWQYLY
jgi:hypothetical protein